MRKLLLGMVSVAFLASSATAADIEEPMPEAIDIWSGFYLGVQAGYAWGEVDLNDQGFDEDSDHDVDGFIGGAHAGFNFQSGNLLLGIEGDFYGADVDGDSTCENTLFRCESDIDMFATLRGKVGWVFDRVAIYGTVGGAWADYEANAILLSGDPAVDEKGDTDLFGLAVGVGGDILLSDRVSLGAQVLWLDFEEKDIDLKSDCCVDAEYDVDLDMLLATIRASFHF